ncbi:hypothetical protein BLNAU_1516 [Blattamonas nauphoetae]|uniref:Uncharacterized protein n=1 Tax=Blattamonas nauphoetae TaxID=2049346 RepID=A0ABQ9YIC3_9EUKA|nr:hypothetical protein BLNAU_1516 [Blattamonas nauphoetae]
MNTDLSATGYLFRRDVEAEFQEILTEIEGPDAFAFWSSRSDLTSPIVFSPYSPFPIADFDNLPPIQQRVLDKIPTKQRIEFINDSLTLALEASQARKEFLQRKTIYEAEKAVNELQMHPLRQFRS